MSITTTFGTSVLRKPFAGASWSGLATMAVRSARRLLRTPLLLWSLVVAAALLAFFVHLLNEQVLRGQMLREEQRAAATRPSLRTAVPGSALHPGHQLIATRQPMTRP